jgi:hypothetical protein
MTEDQLDSVEEVEEKEEKRKIKVISEIDDRLGIQGQAYMRGDLKEALALSYEIIELAEPEELKSFIREQEDLIARIKRLIEEREEKEREKIRLEQAKQRLEKIKKLKTELNQLEYSYKAGINSKDFLKTEEVIEKAKPLLSELEDDKIKKKWDEFEKKHNEAKIRKELSDKVEKLMLESSELKEKFRFRELKSKLTSIIKQLKDNNITEYIKEIEAVLSDILNAEKDYLNVIEKIKDLVQEIKSLQEAKKYEKAISQCQDL